MNKRHFSNHQRNKVKSRFFSKINSKKFDVSELKVIKIKTSINQ